VNEERSAELSDEYSEVDAEWQNRQILSLSVNGDIAIQWEWSNFDHS